MPPELVGILVYLLGLALLFLELFIPSGGILGVSGTVCTIYGIWQLISWNGWVGGVVICLTCLYIYGIIKFWARRVTMTKDLSGADSTSEESAPVDLLGCEGVTTTVLRPAGYADIGGRRIQVVTEGRFLPKGTKVRVTQVVGNRVVVAGVEEARPSGPDLFE